MKLRNGFFGAVVGIAAMSVPGVQAHADTLAFNLDNHPNGNAQPPQYGLRLDYGDQNNLFHFDNVIGVIDTDTDILSISGTVFHATDETNGFSGQTFMLTAEILFSTDIDAAVLAAMGATPPSGAFAQLDGNTTSLTLALLDDTGPGPAPDFNGPLAWQDHMGFHIDTDHRVNSPDTFILEGWGWLEPQDQMLERVEADDWLFVMTPIPEPASLTLLGLGLSGIVFRSSRRRKEK